MQMVRFAVIGLGSIGSRHVAYMADVRGAKLAAVCDIHRPQAEKIAASAHAAPFDDYRALLDSGLIDAILIATPHFQHEEIAVAAFERGIHVLCEKPVAVTVNAARRINAAYTAALAKHANLKFGLMFQQRTFPMYRRLREMVAGGEIGAISRITWIITDWFRTNPYYASGGWRGTWAGEGGGVLMNQCPHNLDLLQWITGLMPQRITAIASCGKTHPVEVEDEVTAILEYPGGAVGQFITTTGEAPGENRLEIAGDNGLAVAEGNQLRFRKTQQSVRHLRETLPAKTRTVPTTLQVEELESEQKTGLKPVTQNFVNAVLNGEPLVAPGIEGVNGLELANAMLMAGLTRRSVELPLDGNLFERFLDNLVQQSTHPGAAERRAAARHEMARNGTVFSA